MALTESDKRQDKKEKPLTKVIIRRLPPSMTKEQFLNQVSPIPDYNYLYHVKGDMSLGENAFSRAYINFVCPEDVYGFKEKFDNYVFVDSKGHEYTAVVEFAPFQKIPKKRGKIRMDPKCNSIDSDTYYLEFVANLNKPVEQDAKPEYTLQLSDRSDDKKKDITTPLLEFIKNKRAQKLKIREVRREERERRKKEFERRKEHGKYEGKYYDEKSPSKVYGKKPHVKSPRSETSKEQGKPEKSDEKLGKDIKEKHSEKQSPEVKPKEKKGDEKKEKKEIKPRFPKKEYTDNRDYKRDDYSYRDYRPKHYEEYKKEDTKTHPKKIKKYSEKREERKIEAQKAEQKKLEQQAKEKEVLTQSEVDGEKVAGKVKSKEKEVAEIDSKDNDEEIASATKQPFFDKDGESEGKKKDADEKSEAGSSSSKRIRNKDRPTIPLYRPGMLSKRKQPDDDISKGEPKSE